MPGATRLFPFRTREAVATLTCAADAISRSPTLPFLGETFFMGLGGRLVATILQTAMILHVHPNVKTQRGKVGTDRLDMNITIEKHFWIRKRNFSRVYEMF